MLWQFLAFIVLLIVGAFFVAAEYALVSVRKTRISLLAKQENISAIHVEHFLDNLQRTLSVTQLGLSMDILLMGTFVETPLTEKMELWLLTVLPLPLAHFIGLVVPLLFITAAQVVLSEQLPKYIALQHAERVALLTVGPLRIFASVLKPFSFVLYQATRFFLWVFRQKPGKHDEVHSPEEIEHIIRETSAEGFFGEHTLAMILQAFGFEEKKASDVNFMLPRTRVTVLPTEGTIADFARVYEKQPHSFFPLVGIRGLDEVTGYIRERDILGAIIKNPETYLTLPLKQLRVDIPLLPSTVSLSEALLTMQDERADMLGLVDEFGGTVGIVRYRKVVQHLTGGRGPIAN